jgi:hypothetical protein
MNCARGLKRLAPLTASSPSLLAWMASVTCPVAVQSWAKTRPNEIGRCYATKTREVIKKTDMLLVD